MNIRQQAIQDVITERESQPPFDDSLNTPGLWVSYIVNYASRWAMPYTFDVRKYNFRTCMVKAAALALAAIEWFDSENPNTNEVELAKEIAETGR